MRFEDKWLIFKVVNNKIYLKLDKKLKKYKKPN